jgi:hypothetical protein
VQNEKCKVQNGETRESTRRVDSETFCILHFAFLILHFRFFSIPALASSLSAAFPIRKSAMDARRCGDFSLSIQTPTKDGCGGWADDRCRRKLVEESPNTIRQHAA